MKILIADDEREIRTVVRLLLKPRGYTVTEAQNGAEAVAAVAADPTFDLVIMDMMMPVLGGLEATEQIRRLCSVPILFLTAKTLPKDKLAAFDAGGDDFLVKPFSGSELVMRVGALVRRYTSYRTKGEHTEGRQIALPGGVVLWPDRREVFLNGTVVDVRDREMDVLIYLATHRGQTVDAATLYEAVWGERALPTASNTVTVHILNLRRKLEADGSAKMIRTVWGKGYRID